MFNHVYPAWHKTVQRVLFIIGALLCITLPVAYGKRRRISSKTLGIVLGLYFGLWLLFSLIVRFLVPSPRVESTLPTYTPSPIPVPVVLHSPSRSSAKPSSPAIRLHPSSVHGATPSSGTARSGRGARFAVADDGDGDDSYDNEDYEDNDTKDGSLTTPAQQTTTRSNSNTVKFQTRPRGNTGDSTNSLNYPTFAAYRQAQHGNFDAFAQRIKRAFISQQQQQQEEMEKQKQLQELASDASLIQTQEGSRPIHLQSLAPSGDSNANNNTDASSLLSPPYSATVTATTEARPTAGRSRSSSSAAAAASILGDFAVRIKSGSLFSRSSTSLALPARSMTDPQPQPQPLAAGARSGLSSSSRPKSQRSPSRLGMDDGESSGAVEDGLEVVVSKEDPEAPTTPNIVSKGDETSG
ncbi:hypothetical protein BGZ93_002435 [Podila epicladia]|nr:hypothetical protein BGZ92_001349 [Podila epicladia]KAG0082453.1 hypothetical protein BGZ93_002435 [Podila epicladia]